MAFGIADINQNESKHGEGDGDAMRSLRLRREEDSFQLVWRGGT